MWGKRELRAHLQERLGVGERQLQRLVAKRAAELPSTTDEALYVLAHENGLRLQNYLTPMQIADVRALVQGRSVAPAPAPTPRTAASRKSTTRSPEFIVDAITVPAGVLSERHFRDATLMAKDVYPLLYAFENSAREFIDGHLVVTYGSDWWDDSKLVSTGVRRTVEISRRAERENRTHGARNARPIYYTTFGDLVSIVESENGRKVFKPPLFPRATWFTELVKSSEHSRNIVAHMNPLSGHDIKRLRIDIADWMNQIKGHLPPTVP
jgi:HEPN superfamily Swt1-like protein